MKILCTTSTFNTELFPKHHIVISNPFKRRLSEEEVLKLVKKNNPDGIVAGVEPLTRNVMESSENLKVISRCGVGLDSIDMEAACKLKIKIFNTPEIPVKPVAELTVSMIYSLTRCTPTLTKNIREGKWIKTTGGLVSEKTIGIIGCGRIGTHVAKMLLPTGSKILGHDPAVKEHPLCRMVSFEHLIINSDVITLHIPFTLENKNILNEEVLRKTKPGTIIINNSRGGLIDENALFKMLKSGYLGGAGLDVFSKEPYKGPLIQIENIILTPHIGSSAGNSRSEMEKAAVKNLCEGFKSFELTQQ